MSTEDRYSIDGHKAHLHPQRIAQWIDAGTDWEKIKKIYPIYVEIAPAGQCNHRCVFCAVDYIGYKNVQIERNALRHCLADMAHHGVKSVMYAGEGEPLLAKNIAEITNYTKSVGIDVAFTTNATGLTEEIARECLGSVSWLKASVNAGNRTAYAKIHNTKPSHFDTVVTNLGRAVELRKEYGWSVTIGAQMVLLPENWDTAYELCITCKDIGLDYVVIKPYSQQPHSTQTAELYGNLNYDSFGETLHDDLAALTTDTFKVVYRKRTMRYLSEPERLYKTCHSTPMFWAYIMATGDVYGCGAHLLDDRFKYGNINDQSFSEIWEGDKRRQCVELMRSFDISECRKNCRMEHVNRYLWNLKNPEPHDTFI